MRTDNAVSPVIGVLLMLTLTLITVAIVNNYAGGLMNTEPKAPSVTLKESFHNSYNNYPLEIRHISGDPLPTSSVKVIIRPTETFGYGSSQKFFQINKSFFIDNVTSARTWENGITTFRPGDIAMISKDHLNTAQSNLDTSYWITNSSNQGKTYLIEFYYKNTMISRNEVLIEG